MIRPRSWFIPAVAPALAALGVAAAPAAQAAQPAGLLACDGALDVRPKLVVLACGDANTELLNLRWTSFGGFTARATGTLAVNECDPNCADGTARRTRVRVIASRARTIAGERTYTRLALTNAKGKPAGRYGIDRHGPYQLQG